MKTKSSPWRFAAGRGKALAWAALAVLFAGPALQAQESDLKQFLGAVLVQSDDQGRVRIAVDEAVRGGSGDGVVEHVFFYYGTQLPAELLQIHLGQAQVVWGNSGLEVNGLDRPLSLIFQVSAGPADREAQAEAGRWVRRGDREELQLLRGDGIAYYPGPFKVSLDELERAGFPISATSEIFQQFPDGGGDSSGGCTSGGPGSTACSQSGNGGSCSVSCTGSSHACCKKGTPPSCFCTTG